VVVFALERSLVRPADGLIVDDEDWRQGGVCGLQSCRIQGGEVQAGEAA